MKCNKCGKSGNRDYRAGLCDKCAFPAKSMTKKMSAMKNKGKFKKSY